MENKVWDPLASGREADTEIVSAAQKREIKNILKILCRYVRFFFRVNSKCDGCSRSP